jgi:RNA 2',3'-cyclic 3'-phosphodiesterase
MRTFIAIELPAEIKSALAAAQDELRQARAQVSWTKPDNLHLTLKFLGEIEAAQINSIAQACAETARQYGALSLHLDQLGCFPNSRQPRVVWAGLAGDLSALAELQKHLEDQIAALGLAHDIKPFRPHLTLGRVKTPPKGKQLAEAVAAYRLPALAFTGAEIVLMQSQLQPTGSIYTPLHHARLGAT